MTAGPSRRPGPLVRPGRPGDATVCAAVHVRCWQQSYPFLVPPADLARLDPAERVPRWAEALAGGTVVVAEAGGAVVGFAAVRLPAELALLYLDAAAQGRGLGRRLHDAGLALLPPGATPVLWVLEGNASARAAYAAWGWTPTGERQDVDVAGTTLTELRLQRLGSGRQPVSGTVVVDGVLPASSRRRAGGPTTTSSGGTALPYR